MKTTKQVRDFKIINHGTELHHKITCAKYKRQFPYCVTGVGQSSGEAFDVALAKMRALSDYDLGFVEVEAANISEGYADIIRVSILWNEHSSQP